MFKSTGRMFWFFVTFLAFSAANAQSDKSLPGCEPPRELRIAMREQLDRQKFLGMKTYERIARRVEIIQALMEKFPREVLSRARFDLVRSDRLQCRRFIFEDIERPDDDSAMLSLFSGTRFSPAVLPNIGSLTT